ncbi:Maff2 family protein, partial [Dysosmobacter welbionis]
MDLDLQAQHVLQLVLRPGTFPIREIDQRHGLGSPAEDKGDGVPLVEF